MKRFNLGIFIEQDDAKQSFILSKAIEDNVVDVLV